MRLNFRADRVTVLLVAFLVSGCAAPVLDADIECGACPTWNQPQEAFQISRNTWYVSVKGLSVFVDPEARRNYALVPLAALEKRMLQEASR